MTAETVQPIPETQWGRLILIILAAFLFGWAFLAITDDGRKNINHDNDPANQTLWDKANNATFVFAYQRNTSAEAMANQVNATKEEFIDLTGRIMFNNPTLEPTEAARAALLEIRRRNLFGQSLQN